MQTKGLTQKKRNTIIRIWKGKFEHERERAEKRIRRHKAEQIRNSGKTDNNSSYRQKQIINLPENFNLHDNYEKVMRVMNDLRIAVNRPIRKNHSLYLNFDKIKHIDIASALVLAADIDVWRMKMGELESHHESWHPHIRVLLNEMGLFKLLGMQSLKEKSTKPNVSFVKFLSAQLTEGIKVKTLRERIESTMSALLSIEQRGALYTSLSESLVNAKQHAYPNPDNLRRHEKWWITAAYNKKARKLTVAIYDRGLTIPKTMMKKGRWEETKAKYSLIIGNDAKFIEVAMRESMATSATRSRTGEPHRGKGLRQLLDLTALENSGKVHIISGTGHCRFSRKGENLVVEMTKNLNYPMHGTLIEWQISV